jgi:hypothetical protein
MFFNKKNENHLIERNHLWYLETATGYEGPFDTEAEAQVFARIRRCADSARMELVDLSEELV